MKVAAEALRNVATYVGKKKSGIVGVDDSLGDASQRGERNPIGQSSISHPRACQLCDDRLRVIRLGLGKEIGARFRD